MIEKMKKEIIANGYLYDRYGNYAIEIQFPTHIIFIDEKFSNKLHVRIENYKGKILDRKNYKTIEGVMNYIKRNSF